MSNCVITISENPPYEYRLSKESNRKTFFTFSCRNKKALLLEEDKDEPQIIENVIENGVEKGVSFDPATSRILIDVDSVEGKSFGNFAPFNGGLSNDKFKEELNLGAYGIYSACFCNDTQSPEKEVIQIEFFPAKKVACKGNFDDYKNSCSVNNYKQCNDFLSSMATELLEKSALYVYGAKKKMQFTGLNFDEKNEKHAEAMSGFIFFMLYAKRIQKALESVMSNPHRVLAREYPLERLEKIARVDSRSVRNLFTRPSEFQESSSTTKQGGFLMKIGGNSFIPRRMEQSRCVESYNTPENLFVVFVARAFSIKLLAVIEWLEKRNFTDPEKKDLQVLKQRLISFLSRAPFAALNQRPLQHPRFPFRSKVFAERQGYVEIAKMWRIFEKGEPFSKNLANLFALRRYCDIFELLCYFRVIKEVQQQDPHAQGKFQYAGRKERNGDTTQCEYQDIEKGLNWGCRYEIGQKAVLYNFPIPCFAKELKFEDGIDVFERAGGEVKEFNGKPVHHQRPDILVMTRQKDSWKIEKLIDAKFRNHSLGDNGFESGCHEIQKYFWNIQDDLWCNFTDKRAEGYFIEGETPISVSFKTTIVSDQKRTQRILKTEPTC